MDYWQVRALVQQTSERGGHKEEERGRSRSPKGVSKKQRGRVGGDHPLRGSDGRYRTTPDWKANLLRIHSECWWMFLRVSDEEASTPVRILLGTTPHRGVPQQSGVEATQRFGQGEAQG